MAVILPFGRALSRQTIPRSNYLLTRLASFNSPQRVVCDDSNSSNCKSSGGIHLLKKVSLLASRGYATAAASKPASRPKAHTGRATAKKSSPKTKTAATKKKPAAKAKPKTKAKAKPKPKAPKRAAKKVPSKASVNRARIAKTRDLRTAALLTEPKQLPANAWTLYFTQERTGIKTIQESAEKTKELAQKFKTLAPEEHERLNHTANQNKAKNDAAYKQWVSKYTPAEVKEANNARKALSKEKKIKEGKKRAPVHLIKDDRLVKQPVNGYSFFVKDRFASGDFKHMALAEASKLIGREWKALSTSEKQPFNDQQQADHNRYIEEATTVYGKAPPSTK